MTEVDNSLSQGYTKWETPGGKNTKDMVFLLSYAEANKYLGVKYHEIEGADQNMKSRVASTAYASDYGAYDSNSIDKTSDGKAATWWWLRSPGLIEFHAACVVSNGSLDDERVEDGSGCVRPALWIDLESGVF